MKNEEILKNPKKGKKKERKREKNGQFLSRSDQICLDCTLGIQDTGEFRDFQCV
jgi:hypothetical protein